MILVCFSIIFSNAALASNEQSYSHTASCAHITNLCSNNVSIIDTATNSTVIAMIPVSSHTTGIAVSPNGKKAYVANSGSNTVSIIDTTTNKLRNLEVTWIPSGVAVTPDGTKV